MKPHNITAPGATAERFAALSRVGLALMSKMDESALLHLIAETACDLTGAAFAAFSLRPLNEEGEPLVPSEGSLFHLAAIVGVTRGQEALLRRMPLGGEGLLAPIFLHGRPVRVADARAFRGQLEGEPTAGDRNGAREVASAYAQGQLPTEELRSLGVPRGHPFVRSFLGVPLLDHTGQVRGRLLLGHPEPDQFTQDDELLLVSLASQAAVALENVRLYRLAERRSQQVQAIFESIADGIVLMDPQGTIVRENGAARRMREWLEASAEGEQTSEALLHAPARLAFAGEAVDDLPVQIGDGNNATRTYLVHASPLHSDTPPSGSLSLGDENTAQDSASGAVVVWHDVTEQRLREAERELVARAQQLQAVFETMTDGVFVYDRNGTIVQMNSAARKLFALDTMPDYAARPLRERLAQLVVRDMQGQDLPLEQLPPFPLLHGEVLTGERVVEVLVRALDGREIQASIGGAPLRDQDGRVIGAVMVVRDMSERYRLERRLQEAERQAKERTAQLEAIFEAMTDALFVYDREGRVIEMNAAGNRFLDQPLLADYAARPLQERLTHALVYDEQGQQIPHASLPTSRILAGEVLTPARAVDMAMRGRNGQMVHLSVTGGPLHDMHGQISGAVTISRDITQRRRLEQAERRLYAQTKAQQALLQLILDELPSSVYLVRGRDAQLLLANKAAHSVWGADWSPDQPMSEFLIENGIRLFGMDGQALAPEQWATLRALRNGEPVFQYQEIIRHADGTTLPVLVNAVPLDASHLVALSAEGTKHLTEGTDRAALVMHQDVTALKEAERLKDEFIAIAAHELRNPLAVLKGYTQTLLFQHQQGRGSELEEWQQEALQNIDKATLRLTELTEELLDVTRLQAGRLEFHPEPTDLVALCRRIVKRLQMTTEQHRLSLRMSPDYLVVSCDPGRMEQVLSNLLGNAIKYSPEGGPIEVALWEEREAGEALFSVRDAGIGIPAQEQARIFGRFARAKNARKITGTGLGLYLCRALVEQHDGRIWFESVEGKGSTFFVALPLFPHEDVGER